MDEVQQKRNVLSIREKEAVCKYCLERQEISPELNKFAIFEKAAYIFSISVSQVYNIYTKFENGEDLEDSKKGGKKAINTNDYYREFLKKELQRKIYSFHQKNEHFTIDDLHVYATQELDFNQGRTTLYKIIRSMGYRYKKCNNRLILCEQSQVKAKKIKFLQEYLQYLHSNIDYMFIFLDETWIYQNGSQVRTWINDGDIRANPKRRFTILHAGCEQGFLENCDLLLDTKIEDRDYHKTMNGEVFKTWVETQLIPALSKFEKKCVVIFDNAPYHSVVINKPPNYNSRKADMQRWLENNNINFPENATKKELWALIKPLLVDYKKLYVIDELLKSCGHEVLRLPPYNCQFNAIELAWASVKMYYNRHIRDMNIANIAPNKVREVWKQALAQFTPEKWKNSVEHCEKLIKADWQKYMGNHTFNNIPPIVISLMESDSENDADDDLF